MLLLTFYFLAIGIGLSLCFFGNIQAPGKKRKRSSTARIVAPPEDLIENSRRKEILTTFRNALESAKNGKKGKPDDYLPISSIKKPLKQLQLVSAIDIKSRMHFCRVFRRITKIFPHVTSILAWDRCARGQTIF